MYFSRMILAVPVLGLLSLTVLAVPHRVKLPRGRPDNQTLNRERADAVKEAFTFSWNGYKKYAFPHDELHPISNSYSDSRYGWIHNQELRN
jgi:mannosyl-oligosaccharide alpha-1,2-mannosidase